MFMCCLALARLDTETQPTKSSRTTITWTHSRNIWYLNIRFQQCCLVQSFRIRTSRKTSILSHSISLQAYLYSIFHFDLKSIGPLHPQAWSGSSQVAPFVDVNMLSGVHTDGFLRPIHFDLCWEHFQLYRQFRSLNLIGISFIQVAIAKSCRLIF